MTCQQLTELVTDYLEGRLSVRQWMAFHMHLGMCSHCRAYLRQMKVTVRTMGKLPEESIPAEVRDDLLARFRKMHPPSTGKRMVPQRVRLLAALEEALGGRRGWEAAGVLLLGAVAVLLLVGIRPGPLGTGPRCLLMELGAGAAPVAGLGWLASTTRSRISAGTLLTLGMAGGLMPFAILEVTCPMRHVAHHVLLFHLGGMLFVGLVALAASRMQALR